MKRATTDGYHHKGLRNKLVTQLREKGITNEKVLEAMNTVPRHFFLVSAFDEKAYEDIAFPIAADQTISQPYTVAYQTQLLNTKTFDKVLEIGTGSAYQAVILAQLGVRVFTIERQKALYELNNDFPFLKKFPTLKRFYGDGFLGLPTYAPFDKVLITAAAPYIPPALLAQLKVGGVMVLPEGEGEVQVMKRITKMNTANEYTEEVFEEFSFVPMLKGKNS